MEFLKKLYNFFMRGEFNERLRDEYHGDITLVTVFYENRII